MRALSLIDQIKELKNSKPVVQPPRNRERMERIMRFQQMNGISLSVDSSKQKKKPSKKGGIFDSVIFCFPLIDPPNDPPPEKLVQLAKGIYSQGGKLVQFNTQGQNKIKIITYVLIDQRSDIGSVRQLLKGKLIYTAIINYKWVEESLRKFRRLQILNYNLQINFNNQSKSPEGGDRADNEENKQEINPRKQIIKQFITNKTHKIKLNPSTNNRNINSDDIYQKITKKIQLKNNIKESQQKQLRQQQSQQQINKQKSDKVEADEQNSDSDTVEMQKSLQQEKISSEQHIQTNQNRQNVLVREQVKVQQQQIEIKQEQKMQIQDIKLEANQDQIQTQRKQEQISSFMRDLQEQREDDALQSKIYPKIQEENDDSDVTQKMDSDDDNKEVKIQDKIQNLIIKKRGYLRQKSSQIHEKIEIKEQKKEELPLFIRQQPEINRKKTKLAIGSHQFPINNLICQKLKQMQQIYQDTNDRKKFAYLRAIAAIRNYGKEIRDAEQLRNIDGLGSKTILKIKQFLQTGNITKVQNRLKKKSIVPYKQLLRVYGIGPNTAEELYHKGIKTIKDLQNHPQLLNKNQKMGLKYVKDFQQRIPRQKITQMLQYVRQILFYVVRSDSHHEIQAVGSYRRGKETCGDIDILITRKDGYVQKTLLNNLVSQLQKRNFITDSITQPKNYDGRKSVNYMGVCKFKDQIHHRIDLKHYPVDQYAFALLYFTGSDLFNRQMRMVAHDKGLILGDSGVRKIERSGMGKVWRNGKIPVCLKEQDIFKLLDMDYKFPGQREL